MSTRNTAEIELLEYDLNPLDCVEGILTQNQWQFDRLSLDELTLNVSGKGGQYRLFFIWEENLRALQFCVQIDSFIEGNNLSNAKKVIQTINEELWLGHFDLPQETSCPTYRYTALVRSQSQDTLNETIEDLIDISMAQCEKYASAFTLLTGANDLDVSKLSLALMDTKGES